MKWLGQNIPQWAEECLEREEMDLTNADNPFKKFGYKGGEKVENQ